MHAMRRLALALGMLLVACTEPPPPPPKPQSLMESLPELIAKVNGEAITRDEVLQRVSQFRAMLAHQRHGAQRGPAASDAAGGPPQASAGSAAHLAHQVSLGPGQAAGPVPLEPAQEKAMLRAVIDTITLERLKRQEAERLGLSVPTEAVEEQARLIEQRMGSPEVVRRELQQAHTTMEEWRTELRRQLLYQQLEVSRRAALPVSDQDIERYWERNRTKLAPAWGTERLDRVRDRIRMLIQQERWTTAKREWEQELFKGSQIWVDQTLRRQLVVKAGAHSH